MSESGGSLPINLYYQNAEAQGLLRFGVDWSVKPTEKLITQLKELIGENSVELSFK